MRRLITLSILAVTMLGGVAMADRDHGRGRGNNNHGPTVRGPVVRGTVRGPTVRTTVRTDNRRHYTGVVRANRQRIDRRPIYVNNNQFTFHGGVSYRYTRPTIRTRYYDVRVRPQIVVENYPAQPGYIWMTGQWSWGSGEWMWVSGHYEADPQYAYYYDDGSWE